MLREREVKMLRPLLISLMVGGGIACAAYSQTPPSPLADSEASAAPAVIPDGDVAAGEEIYSTECRVCHSGLIAPSLRGVIGRPIAGVETFGGYSEGLKAHAGETWTDANLATFLEAPSSFAPGTGMSKSFPDAQTRANIIAFLKTLPPPR
jgi:cytochrome c